MGNDYKPVLKFGNNTCDICAALDGQTVDYPTRTFLGKSNEKTLTPCFNYRYLLDMGKILFSTMYRSCPFEVRFIILIFLSNVLTQFSNLLGSISH